jgi:hypothetical protein
VHEILADDRGDFELMLQMRYVAAMQVGTIPAFPGSKLGGRRRVEFSAPNAP